MSSALNAPQIRLGSFQKYASTNYWHHEIFVADSINELVHVNPSGKRIIATHNFLQWVCSREPNEEEGLWARNYYWTRSTLWK